MLAGFAKRSIAPKGSVPMAGFDLRSLPSEGVLDEIMVWALALKSDAGDCLVVLSFDLLGVPYEFCETTAELIRRETNAEALICATHTHAAPGSVFARRDGDETYIDFLKEAALQAAREAVGKLEPVRAFVGSGKIDGVASFRDVPRERSAYSMPVFRVKLEGNTQKTELIRFACHCTVLSEKNLLISKDLAGILDGEDRVMLNGACGDLSTRYTRVLTGEAELNRMRSLFGKGVSSVRLNIDECFGKCVRVAKTTFTLPCCEALSEAVRQRLIAWHEQRLAGETDPAGRRESESILAVLRRPPREQAPRRITLLTADLGSLVILAVPFEVNSADGERIEAELTKAADKPVLLVCYAMGYAGYLPSGRPIDENSNYQDVASAFYPTATGEVLKRSKQLIASLKEETE